MSDVKQARPGRLLFLSAVFVLATGAIALVAVPNEYLAPRRAGGVAGVGGVEQPPDAPPPTVSATGTAVYGAPTVAAPLAMGSLDMLPVASMIVDVHQPAELWRIARDNAWLQDILKKPLGRGFLGTWAGFLGTRGEDIRAEFEGLVIEHLAEQVLDEPFRAVWFSSGRRTTGKPAIILEDPSDGAERAFNLLHAVASRGTYTAERCYDGEPPEEGDYDRPLKLEGITIKRWLLADHAVYASFKEDRLVIGRRPTVVLQGMCADLPATPTERTNAVEISFVSDTLGRGANLMTKVLGVTATPRLAFAIEDGNLVPRGIQADVVEAGHLVTGKLSKAMLRAIPEVAPVVLTVQLALPKELDKDSMRTYFAGEKTDNATRQIAVVWYPSGESDGVMDIALLWSQDKDADFVDEMFGGNMMAGYGCKVMVRCTNESVCEDIQRACTGKDPSVLQSSPAVKAGWQAESSVALGIHVGRTLSSVTVDAYTDEQGEGKKGMPPEMQEVKTQLEALPFFGLSGKVQGKALVPGGFRS